jgi:hypothetical protein
MSEGEAGMFNAAIQTGGRVMQTLPGQFLALVLMNSIFIGGLFLFLDRGEDRRERVLAPVLKACAEDVPMATVEKFIHLPKE